MCNNVVVKNKLQHTLDEYNDQFGPIVKKLKSLQVQNTTKTQTKYKQISLFQTTHFKPPKDLSKISILNIDE